MGSDWAWLRWVEAWAGLSGRLLREYHDLECRDIDDRICRGEWWRQSSYPEPTHYYWQKYDKYYWAGTCSKRAAAGAKDGV